MRRTTTRSAPRRQTVWIRASNTLTTDANGYVGVDVLADIAQVTAGVVTTPALLGATVTRIRGMITGNDASLSGIGILSFKVTSDIITTADRPSLAANREDDWLGWVNWGYDVPTKTQIFTEFDVKGQRKMTQLGQKLYGLVDMGSAAGANQIAVVTSVLLTLP